MANNTGSPLLNPILSFLMDPTPASVPGGGKSRKSIVQSRLAEQKIKLSNDLTKISQNDKPIVSHAGKIHIVAKMFEDSFAPSWTPDDIFTPETKCRIVAPSYNGYLIEIPLTSLNEVKNKISKAKTVNEMVDVSRIESITSFAESATLRNKKIEDIWDASKKNNTNQFNIWILPFFDSLAKKSVINTIVKLYENGVIKSGYPEFDIDINSKENITPLSSTNDFRSRLPEALRKLDKYETDGNQAFTAILEDENCLRQLIASGTVYRVEPVPRMNTNTIPPLPGPDPVPPISRSATLPAVVVIDGGCSAQSYLPLNILSIKPLVSDYDADMKHGNQVVSLVCHGYAWNNNLSLPELECNFISAQAINKKTVTKQPTSEQFINYLRQIAHQTKHKAKVWNLSFNESYPSLNPAEISYLGHEINKIARENNILPVISIGNVTVDNKSRLCPPADCESALTISGREADCDGKPYVACPYSLKGPAPAGMKKPELSWFSKLRVIGGVQEIGTSFSAPLISSIAAHTFENIKNPTPDLIRALLINKSGQPEHNAHLGWGTPWLGESLPWHCDKGTVTLTWVSKLKPGYAHYWNNIPLPPEMLVNGNLCGEISLTAILKPVVSELGGENYFSTRLVCALQSLKKVDETIKAENLLGTMRESKDKELASRKELSKWSPIRHHSKAFKNTKLPSNTLRLYSRIYARDLYQYELSDHHELGEQEVSFVLTFKSEDKESGIYNTMAQKLGVNAESAVINQEIDIDINN